MTDYDRQIAKVFGIKLDEEESPELDHMEVRYNLMDMQLTLMRGELARCNQERALLRCAVYSLVSILVLFGVAVGISMGGK